MSSLRHFALGEPFPDSPHAVISCLPTMKDVRDYEEHQPRVVEALKSGYPRFVVHEFVQQLMEFYLEREALAGRYARIVLGRRAADDLLGWLGLDLKSSGVMMGSISSIVTVRTKVLS